MKRSIDLTRQPSTDTVNLRKIIGRGIQDLLEAAEVTKQLSPACWPDARNPLQR